MTHKAVSVSGNDGSALYIDGKLISNWFTVGEEAIISALGYPVKVVEAEELWWESIGGNFPYNLSGCVLKEGGVL